MDLYQLKYVIEIASMHSISRAAENLFISQSTLSQFLTKLEAELGVSLFERRRNEMALTAAGKLYVETCKQMLQQKEELYHQLSNMAQSKTGSFTVGITPQWGAVAYSHIIGSFQDAYPYIHVSVIEETAIPLIRLLKEGQIDMGIIPLADNSSLPPESILLQAEELVLAIPRDHASSLPLNYTKEGLPSIDAAALINEPMIFSQTKTTPHIVAEINSHPASLIMVEQNLGSTFVPVSCMAPSEKIVYAHAVPLVQWFVVIAFRKGFTLHQSEQYFISLVKNFFRHIKA